MSVIDETVKANEEYARGFERDSFRRTLHGAPARRLAVVACMDGRMNIEELLGLKTGDAHIIRNAGGIVTEDAIRSLVISHHLLGTREIMIINHTDCGLMTFRDEDLRQRLRRVTGTAVVSPSHFHSFMDVRGNVLEQIQKVRSHPWIPRELLARGFVYDVRTGRLEEVDG